MPLARIPAPSIPVGPAPEELSLAEYEDRIRSAQKRMTGDDLDVLVVYADREHFGDLCFLIGTDPRFEEAIYVLGRDGRGTLLLGNENLNEGPARDLGIRVVLYQALSPAGQVRTSPVQLSRILRDAGVEAGTRVGVAGGKTYGPGFVEDPSHAISAPSYLVDTLRAVTGDTGSVTNAEDIFTSPVDGLRTISSAHQIALFEYGAAVASSSVYTALQQVRVGTAANQLANSLFDYGIPLTCHSMVNFGAKQGLSSPTPNRAELGDAFTIAQGLRGGLTCRAGAVASGEDDLTGRAREIFPALALNYFDVVATWHESISVGTTAGEVFAAVDGVRDHGLFEFSLNPGHLLHLEEWSQSTFAAGDATPLQSGSMVQCDVIPVVAAPNIYVNIEDGITLADAALRDELANDYPELWDRVQQRRAYLHDVIGVELDASVLPMSTIPLWHTPYALDQGLAFTR